MKIRSVRFKNLNSLKGEHTIDFSKPPFSESGLFAITGATGSGKTTILDAITVALYGRVHRHNKDVQEIMSRHTGECFSEVEFDVADKVYRAKWSLSRARGKADGKLQSEKMELAEVDSGLFLSSHRVLETKQKIVDCCGLDYEQFLRSVILCQGDFTQFLKASDKDRGALLEKITNTGEYSDISKFVYEKHKDERLKLQGLQDQLGGVQLFSDEEEQAYEEDVKQFAEAAEIANAQQDELQKKLKWLDDVNSLKEKRAAYENQLLALQEKEQTHVADFLRLESHLKGVKFRPYLAEMNRLNRDLLQSRERLSRQISDLPACTDAAVAADLNFESALSVLKYAEQEFATASPMIDDTIKLDTEIFGLNQLSTTEKTAFEDSEKAITNLLEEQSILQKKIAELSLKISELEGFLNAHAVDKEIDKVLLEFGYQRKALSEVHTAILDREQALQTSLRTRAEQIGLRDKYAGALDAASELTVDLTKAVDVLNLKVAENLGDRTIEDMELEIQDLPAQLGSYKQLLDTSGEIQDNIEKQSVLSQDIQTQIELCKHQKLELSHLERSVSDAGKLLVAYRKELELEQRIQKYEADRHDLQSGQPCFLCGSTEHPYVDEKYTGKLSETQIKIVEAENEVTQARNKLTAQEVAFKNAGFMLDQLNLGVDGLVAAYKTAEERFYKLNAALNEKFTISSGPGIAETMKKKQSAYDVLQQQLKSARELKASLVIAESTVRGKENEVKELKSQLDLLHQRISSAEQEHVRLLAELDDSKSREMEITKASVDLLLPFSSNFSVDQSAEFVELLKNRHQIYLKSEAAMLAAEAQIRESKVISNTLAKAINEKTLENRQKEHKLADSLRKLEELKSRRFALFADKNPEAERKRLTEIVNTAREYKDQLFVAQQRCKQILNEAEHRIKDLNAAIAELAEKFDEESSKLQRGLELTEIAGIDELKALILEEDVAEQLTSLKHRMKSDLHAASRLLDEASVSLHIEETKAYTSESPEDLKLELDARVTSIGELNRSIGSLTQRLKDNEIQTARFAEVKEQIRLQQAELYRWAALNDRIGSADGQKFRLFAQGLTLVRLVNLANRHLLQLTDRYTILKSLDNDLELLIEDHYQADVVRPMSTLSGGESFLVSLALALGLSELASHNVQINSLFIDEGFGTLDSDTLDMAITALENLQSSGKTIGVISHVEALKESIGTQIRVKKYPGGASKIEVHNGQISNYQLTAV